MEKVIFDVDGTLMDIEHRRHFVSGAMNDWESFLDPKVMKGDSPKWEVVNTAVALHNSGVEIVVVSISWLKLIGLQTWCLMTEIL